MEKKSIDKIALCNTTLSAEKGRRNLSIRMLIVPIAVIFYADLSFNNILFFQWRERVIFWFSKCGASKNGHPMTAYDHNFL